MIHWIKSFGNPGKTAYNDPITKPIIKANVIVGVDVDNIELIDLKS